MMEMHNFRDGEPHVAQQSRRDKLRTQLQNYNDHNLDQLWVHQGQIPDLRDIKSGYDQTVFSSEMLNYATKNSQGLLHQNDSLDNATLGNYFSHPNLSSNLNNIADKVNGEPLWKNINASQQSCDWTVSGNYSGNPSTIFVGGGGGYGYNQDVVQNSQNISSPFDYQATLQVVQSQELDHMVRYGTKDSNELLHLLPVVDDHRSDHLYGSTNPLENRTVDQAFRHWDVREQLDYCSSSQGLALSLSSVPQTNDLSHTHNLKDVNCNYLCSNSRQLTPGNKGFGFEYNRQHVYSVAGPHGPFTGYATILKDSKFLKPTLELLEELCGSKQMKTCEIYAENISHEDGFSGDAFSSAESWPAYHQKKRDLLYLRQEVCRRYKQYQQQMQMVITSFQSVEGVSTATPYISMAIKTISRHFRCLKDAISDQIRQTGKEIGDELPSATAGRSSSTQGDPSKSELKFDDHICQMQKSCGSNRVFFEPQQPVWKPQRGLPERAVSVLRAWLFDHFLHPYPTDTDKHTLAIQTGLTRNQVSNWFINARVRIWKPMVEEIHGLETKGLGEKNSYMTGQASENMASECTSHQYANQPANRLPAIDSIRSSDHSLSEEFWNQEKRSRIECQIPASMEGSLMSYLPYRQQLGGFENGAGLGLTLGLRQNAETVEQQQQKQFHQKEQHQQQFGGQMIHDFVG